MISLTRRTLLTGTVLVALAGLLGAPTALAAEAQVHNETSGIVLHDLFTALAAAAPGDVLTITGRHVGQFTVAKPLTLRGDASAVLDAGGSGTALVVTADDVVLDGLTLTGSGATATFRTLWGDSGLRVGANRLRASGLTVTNNDFGVVLLGGTGHEITGCEIGANRQDGIKVFGGEGHRIAGNRIWENRIGIYVDALYEGGSLTEIVVPTFDDLASLERTARIKDTSVYATGHRIENNLLPGNEVHGIYLCWHTNSCIVAGNDVGQTGVTRPLTDEAIRYWETVLGASAGGPVTLSRDMPGAGIMLVCLPEHNAVTGNVSHDNFGWGMGLDATSTQNLIEANRFERNRDGLKLEGAIDNTIRGNTVTANREHGIIIAAASGPMVARASSGNLIVGNTMSANPVNAFDSSDRAPPYEAYEAMVDQMPLPEALRSQMKANPQIRTMMIQQIMATHVPGTNRWDDGATGNHYDDFDEAPEGFRDANGDGVGEVAHPIPGGGQVDHFPLTGARVEAR
jgi:parallel beta-helix repeat protein